MKTGLLFGSFNPIHNGHLIIASTLISHTDMKAVWFVVSPQNPMKSKKNMANEYDRFEMVNLAIQNNPDFNSSNIEFHLSKPNYTIHTLTHLKEKYKFHEFALLMGEDNLDHFPQWKNYQSILDFYKIYIYPRKIESFKKETLMHPNIIKVDLPLLQISASYIRNLVKEKKSIRYLVPDSVDEFIQKKGLYI